MGCTTSKANVPPETHSASSPIHTSISNSFGANLNSTNGRISQHDRRRDDEITKEQEAHRVQKESKIKLLLLGTGESAGKSTILKQMRILYGSPKSHDDLRMYGVIVRSNIVIAGMKLCLFFMTPQHRGED